MNENSRHAHTLSERTTLKINQIINSPTQVSFPVKRVIESITEKSGNNRTSQNAKRFLPFVAERGTFGKFLPALNLSSDTKKIENTDQSILEDKTKLNSSKTVVEKQQHFKLVSPRAYYPPPVGIYNINAEVNKHDISFPISTSPRLPPVKSSKSSTDFIDWDKAYTFKDKHSVLYDMKRVTGREKHYVNNSHRDAMSLISAKLPDKMPNQYGLLADVDVHGYMSEISHIEKDVRDRLKDIKKAHKNLVKTMLI
ncbi:unnamed protein product [Blepharisma stoltei]|uniref:Uncharacterized protein n=1 Tax=Blepharisma stoltei TaxID=1481888 RepID=A0AAU9J2M3_9CILI|nr:unnamed protein product [Blepharisma stoltei]